MPQVSCPHTSPPQSSPYATYTCSMCGCLVANPFSQDAQNMGLINNGDPTIALPGDTAAPGEAPVSGLE